MTEMAGSPINTYVSAVELDETQMTDPVRTSKTILKLSN